MLADHWTLAGTSCLCFVRHEIYPGAYSPTDHEAFISESCYVVGGIQSLKLLASSEANTFTLGPGLKGSARLLVPSGAIPLGQELRIRYAVLLAGPFSIPEGYNVVSPVLYIDYDISLVKKALKLYLDHWYAGVDRQKTMTFLKAPHVVDEDGVFLFAQLHHGSFSEDEQFAVLKLNEDLCCITTAVNDTGELSYPSYIQLHLLTDLQCVRLYTSYDSSAWAEVCEFTFGHNVSPL